MRRCLIVLMVAALMVPAVSGGCSQWQTPAAMPREGEVIIKQLVTSMADQAVWDRILAQVGAQVIDPGLETAAGVMYVAYARLRGVSAQVAASGTGAGSGELTPAAREAILDLATRDPESARRIAEAIWGLTPADLAEGSDDGEATAPD